MSETSEETTALTPSDAASAQSGPGSRDGSTKAFEPESASVQPQGQPPAAGPASDPAAQAPQQPGFQVPFVQAPPPQAGPGIPQPPYPGVPYPPPPYAQAPYGQAPYGQAPYAQAPYGQAPYGQAPYGQPMPPYPQPPVAPGYGAYPVYAGSYPYAMTPPRRNGLALAGMILGIVGLVGSIFFVGAIVGVVGLILALVGFSAAKRTGTGRGFATAGIVTSVLAIIIGLIVLITAEHDAGKSCDTPQQPTGVSQPKC